MSASAVVRAQAARVVADVAIRGRSLDAALDADGMTTRQERGLLRALCYDSIRWYLRLDALLGRLLARPNQKLAPEVRSLAIVGLCQLFYTDIPAHAAVDETVDAARLLGQPRAAGLINALLRRAQREHVRLFAAIDGDAALRYAHPRWLLDRLAADWGESVQGILAANNQRPAFWVRVNRLRGTGRHYRARLTAAGIGVAASAFQDEALLLQSAVDVGDLPGFSAGDVSVQDAAAQFAARLLAPRPGERILDACAAPGGKTGHLLELQPELESLVAIDVSPRRLRRVADNLRRLGFRIVAGWGVETSADTDHTIKPVGPAGNRPCGVHLIAADAADTADWWDGRPFDRILLDVPCSATGVIRRHPDIKLLRRAEDIPALAARQLHLVHRLWPLLAPGGRLVYASCSALAQETCAVVSAFLSAAGDARDASVAAIAELGDEFGARQAATCGQPGHRIAAGTAGMDGFYYACIEKTKG